MAYTTINKSGDYFNTKLYTGTGSSQGITGVGFQPDWTWIKQRSGSEQHVLFDAVRGVQKYIASNTTAAESTTATTLTAFNSDGFTQGGHGMTGANNATYASWNWKANGAGSANTDGSISSTVSASATSGFSIVKYTGTGSAGATVGHGLGVKPAMIIFKCLSVSGTSGVVYHQSKGATYTLYLNETSAGGASAEMLNNTEPTSSLITLGNGTSSNSSGASTIAYCFAEKQGYSKFGSYTSNNSSNGVFVYTGFKPKFILIKSAAEAVDWRVYDSERLGYNNKNYYVEPNNSDSEGTTDSGSNWDMLSNGFKFYTSEAEINGGTGNQYIYMAFGQSLVGSNNVPCTAR